MKKSTLVLGISLALLSPVGFAKVHSHNHHHSNSSAHHQRSDTVITADIKQAFLKEKLFGNRDISALGINVETHNGVVHLSGSADNASQLGTAISLANTVKGVKSVESEVKINGKQFS